MTQVDIQSLPIGAAVVTDGTVADANDALRQLLDRDPIGSSADDLVEQSDMATLRSLVDGSTNEERIEVRLRAGGPTMLVEVTAPGRQAGLPTVVYFQPLPHRDSLTGLPDRIAFVHHLDLVLRGMRRSRRSALLVLIDLDGFAAINESHGQALGDAVLAATAQRLQASLRPDDTVARLGGDEFIALCPDVDPEHTKTVVVRLQKAANAHIEIDGQRLAVQSTLGVVGFDEPTETVTDLLRRVHAETLIQKAARHT
jgi:diguanylate cyclase (GGDEF)-like protein